MFFTRHFQPIGVKTITPFWMIGLLFLITFYSTDSLAQSKQSLPLPVENALSAAEVHQNLRASFTIKFVWENDIEIIERYDAISQAWTPISGNKERLSRRGRERLRKYKKLEAKPGGLLYSDYRDNLKNVALKEKTSQALIYKFSSPQIPRHIRSPENYIKTELILDPNEGWIRKYLVTTLRPFRKSITSNLSAFSFEQEFNKPFPNGPALMTRLYCRLKGNNAFVKVDEEFSIDFYDFKIIDD